MPWPKGVPFSPESLQKRTETFKANGKKAKKPRIIDGVEYWLCPTCKIFLNQEGFYKSKKFVNGLTSQCKKCHMETCIRTRDQETNRVSSKLYARRLRITNPDRVRERERLASKNRPKTEKVIARQKLNYAVKMGKIIKPLNCSACDKQIKLTAHHTDYSQPYEVVWLCYECHAKV